MTTLHPPGSLPETLAHRSARCPLCRQPIRAEIDYIAKVPQLGWSHGVCASNYRQVLAEHEEGGDGQ